MPPILRSRKLPLCFASGSVTWCILRTARQSRSRCVSSDSREKRLAEQVLPEKALSGPIPKAYNPLEVETGWDKFWNSSRLSENDRTVTGGDTADVVSFTTEGNSSKPAFTVLLPPPNVTGTLHMGHALGVTVQDALIKWHKMKGFQTRWIPGFDHAGIATQVVVQRGLEVTHAPRTEAGSSTFPSNASLTEWADKKRGEMRSQLKRMGVSLNWDEEYFTLDQRCSVAVKRAFIHLFRAGLIYRLQSPVNYCPKLRTVISDLEISWISVERKTELPVKGTSEKAIVGTLIEFEYPSLDGSFAIPVSTTRPETLFGDVAVAVHPSDSRYSFFVGATLVNPFTGRQMPVVADERVKMDYGTGAVKITPAHSHLDFEIGRDHSLGVISVINEDGSLNENCGSEFGGLSRFAARGAVVEALKSRGMFVGEVPISSQVPFCSRSGDLIETILKEQWFFKVTALKERALNLVAKDAFKILPPGGKNTLLYWFEKLNDWCISRQIQWGHRIPAYRLKETSTWVAAADKDEAKELLGGGCDVEQDQDVLDTWFSSALLPLTVNNWPEGKSRNPLSVMETGEDILFFWVARMILMAIALPPHTIPFREILLHGIVYDAQGRKMSKSLGNVIDPINVIRGASEEVLQAELHRLHCDGMFTKAELDASIEGQKLLFPKGVPVIGADAMRFGFCLQNICSQKINLNVDKMETIKFFGNKIWQATKFVVASVQSINESRRLHLTSELEDYDIRRVSRENLSPIDRWILSRLARTVVDVNEGFEQRKFHFVADSFYAFFYGDFCDVYLESVKPRIQEGSINEGLSKTVLEDAKVAATVLFTCVETSLRLLFPLMPHVSEELWQRIHCVLKLRSSMPCLESSAFPEPQIWAPWSNSCLELQMKQVLQLTEGIRNVKQKYNLKRNDRMKVTLSGADKDFLSTMEMFAKTVSVLSCCEFLPSAATFSGPSVVSQVFGFEKGTNLLCDAWGVLTVDDLTSRLHCVETEINRIKQKMSSSKFGKLPAKRREGSEEKHKALLLEWKHLNELLQRKQGLASKQEFI